MAIYSVATTPAGDLELVDCLGGRGDGEPVFVALVSRQPENVGELITLKQNPGLWRYFHNASLIELNGRDGTQDVLLQLLSALAGFLGPLAAHTVEQAHALSATRREYETQHLRFAALESYVQQAGVQLVRERVYLAPDRLSGGHPALVEIGGDAVRQLLPVSSKGICAIDLMVRFIGNEPGARFGAALYLGDTKEPAASWTLSAPEGAEQVDRWVTLSLPRTLDGIARNTMLQLQAEGAGVAVGASRVVANERYCPYSVATGQPVGSRPVAMRIWQAPPGVAVPRLRNVTLSDGLPEASGESCRVPAMGLQQVEPLLTAAEDPEFAEVAFHAGREQISVHPPQKGISIGVLRDLVPADAISVSARGVVASDRGPPVEFALVVAGPQRSGGKPWEEVRQISDVVGWSGWRGIAPTQPHQLSVLLTPQPDGAARTLLLMTRVKPGRSSAFAWARFFDVEIER